MSERQTKPQLELLIRKAISEALVLPLDDIDLGLPFVSLGGDSLSALYVAEFLSESGLELDPNTLLDVASVSDIAEILEVKDAPAAYDCTR